jgi:hypothetical protein
MGNAHDNRIFNRAVMRFKQFLADKEEQQRGSFNRQVDHPKLWGACALVALAVAFSGKVNTMATWICVALAWGMLGAWLIGFSSLARTRARRLLSFGITFPILLALAYFLAPTVRPRLNASLEYVACGCIVPAPEQPHQVDIRRKVVVLYIVTLDPGKSEARIDETSIACYAKIATLNGSDEKWQGNSTTDLYGIAIYAMGGEESINQDDWLAEAAFKGSIKDKIRKRVACEMPQVGNPMYLLFNSNVRFFLSFKETSGKLHVLQGQLAELPMPMRRRDTLFKGVDRRFLGLSMDNVPPRLTDIKPAMLINFAGRVSPDGKPMADAVSKTIPLPFPMNFGFELCSHH